MRDLHPAHNSAFFGWQSIIKNTWQNSMCQLQVRQWLWSLWKRGLIAVIFTKGLCLEKYHLSMSNAFTRHLHAYNIIFYNDDLLKQALPLLSYFIVLAHMLSPAMLSTGWEKSCIATAKKYGIFGTHSSTEGHVQCKNSHCTVQTGMGISCLRVECKLFYSFSVCSVSLTIRVSPHAQQDSSHSVQMCCTV